MQHDQHGGQVSWTFSDGRFKKDIKEDVSGLRFIKQLRPVSYVVDKTAVNKFLHIADSSNAQTGTQVPHFAKPVLSPRKLRR